MRRSWERGVALLVLMPALFLTMGSVALAVRFEKEFSEEYCTGAFSNIKDSDDNAGNFPDIDEYITGPDVPDPGMAGADFPDIFAFDQARYNIS